MTREEVIKGLRCCMDIHLGATLDDSCNLCPYQEEKGRTCYADKLFFDAIALLKTSFTPKEVYDTVIEHGQHDKQFKLGDRIDFSFTEVVDILNCELMCKAGDM